MKKVGDMNIVELKALAYDIIAQKEQCQIDLTQINKLISAKYAEVNDGNGDGKTIVGPPEGERTAEGKRIKSDKTE